jgi:electron transport complex protein RnfG
MTDRADSRVQSFPATPSGAMLRTLGGVAAISGFLVVLAYHMTLPLIEENQRRAIENAIFQVVPEAVTRQNVRLGPDGPVSNAAGEPIYAAYGRDGRLRGVAMEGAAQGYQDVIKLLYGFDPDCQCITGIKILKMTETPGLGDKIAKAPEFQANFRALEASLNSSGDALEHAIVTVKHGTKEHPWEIDAISGATISSNAVGRALNESAQRMVPLIMRNLEGLQAAQPEAGDPTD